MANIERLTQLRRVIEEAPEDRLHMRRWCEKAKCGTAYCAAGWAAVDPWFAENTAIRKIFHVEPGGFVEPLSGEVMSDLAKLFGITNTDARNLFGAALEPGTGPHSVTKKEVLDNIDRLLDGQPAERYAAAINWLQR
jgi:hypothetical protein